MDFILRKWESGDAVHFAHYANNEKIERNLRNAFPYPYTLRDAKNFVESCIANDGKEQLTRAIVVNGKAVGSIGVFLGTDVYCKSAEIGYWLAEDFWNQGIMHNAIKSLCKEAFERFDLVRIFAEPFAHNIGSRKALEKAGFTLEGTMKNGVCKNGKIFDYCMYATYTYSRNSHLR